MNWPWKRRTIVLGAELAAAHEAEEARLAAGVIDPSPLPDERYDFELGDYDLVRVAPLSIDLNLRAFTDEVRRMDSDQQVRTQKSLSMDDLYMLIHFVKRCSVLALNETKVDWLGAGLCALAMIDETRVDWRDARWAAGLLEHAIDKSARAKERLTESAGNLPRSAREFLRKVSSSSKLSDWGYAEINTPVGIGLIEYGGESYHPTVDLTDLALNLSKHLSSDRYITHVEIGVDVSEYWFEPRGQKEVLSTLDRARGAVSVTGPLRDTVSTVRNQMLMVWMVEMPSASDCATLGSNAPDRELDGRFVTSFSIGKLFVLVVGGSFQQGVKPFETKSSHSILAQQIRSLIEHNAGID